MKIFIVEDEKSSARRIVRQIEEILPNNEISVFYEFGEAREAFENEIPDLLILDLNLNGEDGFKILKTIESKDFETIVVSANAERALEGFDLDIVDFVLKPYETERLAKALQKFMSRRNRKKGKESKEILIKDGPKRISIAIDEIIYVSGARARGNAIGEHREIHCEKNKVYLHANTLEKFSEILPEGFLRIHNSYLVNEKFIVETLVFGGGKYEAVLSNGAKLPVSRAKYKEFFGDHAGVGSKTTANAQ